MLSSLHIRNYILIDSLDITFPEGLVIVTGQTGAGKSILLGALSLLGGARADASQISEGADSCVVEAEFDGADERTRELLDENDIEWDGGHLVIRRVVNSSGRSRSFINDCPVPVTLLPQISERLIDIHSQHKSLLLTDKAFQLRMLDFYSGNASLLADCSRSWKTLQNLRTELVDAKEQLRRLSDEGEYNAAQFRQLDEARLQPGELEELELEQKSLANSEQIKEAFGKVMSIFEPEDTDIFPGLTQSLREVERQLQRAGKFVPGASGLSGRVESARIELDDIFSEVSSLDSSVNLSPERLQQVEDRMSLLYSLLKKHSCSDIGELIAVRDRYGASVSDIDTISDRIEALESEVSAALAGYESICAALHSSRVEHAPSFALSIAESLRFLELDRAVFEVDVLPAAPGSSGSDSVMFRFSSTGTGAVDIGKCASGGEISRIMLSLKAMLARYVGMPTLIFDEIDTGVSGSVADRMGKMICSMGDDMQVFSITHLPQVAAKGMAHYVVSKDVRDGRVISSIRKVEGEERVNEIARLLSGSVVTDAAVANARALMDER